MLKKLLNKQEVAYCCKYCGCTISGDRAYDRMWWHESHCCKNQAMADAAKAAVGKMYKLEDGTYIKVLKANDTWNNDNDFALPLFETRPIVIAEIRPETWKSMEDWYKSPGYPWHLGLAIRTEYVYNFDKMEEITQEEWDAAIRRIAEKAMKI